MATGRRVKRLREMVDQIERLPASPDRDRLLSEVRARAVDVDTGVTPRAMHPLREPPPVPPRPPKRDRSSSIARTAPPPPAPAVEFARSASTAGSRCRSLEHPPWLDGRLSLEDSPSPLPEVRGRGGLPVPPWTLGLRG